MDPHASDRAWCAAVQGGSYQTLLRWVEQADGSWTPDVDEEGLATSWEMSEDGLEYTFHLREGVSFTDGTPFDAEAAKWNFDRLIALGLQPSTKLYKASELKVEVVDDYVLKVTLPQPYSPFVYAMVDQPRFISPTAAEANEAEGDYGDHGDYAQAWLYEHAVGTGPYLLDEWRHGESVSLVKNPDYWGGWEGNHLESFVSKVVPEIGTRKMMLQGGECDLTLRLSETDLPELQADPNLVVLDRASPYGLTMQIRPHGAFADQRVRKAVALAFDYDAFADDVLLGLAKVSNGPLIFVDFGWDSTLPPFERDLDRARELMAEAGYADGLEGEFELWTIPSFQWFLRSQAELFQANMAEIGIKVKIVEFGDAAAIMAGMFDPVLENEPTFFPWTYRPASGEAATTLIQHYHSRSIPPGCCNGAFYSNPEVDTLLDESVQEPDREARLALYKEAQRIIIEDQPYLWMAELPVWYFSSSELMGYRLAPLEDNYLHSIYEMWLEAD
jgi:peptide/nickel transport system substrate-binding protein